MPVPIYHVDAFTHLPFGGNPAVVCLLDRDREPEWMQKLAAEMNQSETAFLEPGQEAYRLRWFTPTVEVDLCGHATLAAAHVLWESDRAPRSRTLSFSTRSGILAASSRGELIELDFPADLVEAAQPPLPPEELLGITPVFCGKGRFDYFFELDSESAVRELRPNLQSIARLNCRGVIVTSAGASADFDFVSRFFAPGSGIDEDPVTGSAHCALATYWGERLGRRELVGYQASPRGGIVQVRCAGDRVGLAGRAVTVWSGILGSDLNKS